MFIFLYICNLSSLQIVAINYAKNIQETMDCLTEKLAGSQAFKQTDKQTHAH
jgi:hypothetical protein